MIRILTWNVQAAIGVDGNEDPDRIARVARSLGDADVLCFQEVARGIAATPTSRAPRPGQATALMAAFARYRAFYGAAIDRLAEDGGREQFGNLVLARVPVLQSFRHALPQPADPDTRHMPRQAIEVVLGTDLGPLRVVTTHLEFHSHHQRIAQASRLRDLHVEVCEANRRPATSPTTGLYAPAPRPDKTVLCGDFNFEPGGPEYNLLTAPGPGALVDAWPTIHRGAAHDPTCGVHDHAQWPGGPHCRDFFFCTPDLVPHIRSLRVDTRTDASDHQPLLLELGGRKERS